MAKCKDCGTSVGFMVGRCDSCKSTHESSKEGGSLQKEIGGLSVKFDKMEGTTWITSGTSKLGLFNYKRKYYVQSGIFDANNGKTSSLALIFSQEVPDWYWLGSNKTIFLFPDGNRFVQEHGDLLSSEVKSDSFDNVFCYEMHLVDISEAVDDFVRIYDDLTSPGSSLNSNIMLRIGSDDNAVSLDMLRTIVAVNARRNQILSGGN